MAYITALSPEWALKLSPLMEVLSRDIDKTLIGAGAIQIMMEHDFGLPKIVVVFKPHWTLPAPGWGRLHLEYRWVIKAESFVKDAFNSSSLALEDEWGDKMIRGGYPKWESLVEIAIKIAAGINQITKDRQSK